MDGAAVAILHAVEAHALVAVQMAAIAPAHPVFGPVQAHLAMLQAPGLALVDALLLPVLALVDGLRRGRDCDAERRQGRQSQDKLSHLITPSIVSVVAAGLGWPAPTRAFPPGRLKRG
jgi:hypothetical protein